MEMDNHWILFAQTAICNIFQGSPYSFPPEELPQNYRAFMLAC